MGKNNSVKKIDEEQILKRFEYKNISDFMIFIRIRK